MDCFVACIVVSLLWIDRRGRSSWTVATTTGWECLPSPAFRCFSSPLSRSRFLQMEGDSSLLQQICPVMQQYLPMIAGVVFPNKEVIARFVALLASKDKDSRWACWLLQETCSPSASYDRCCESCIQSLSGVSSHVSLEDLWTASRAFFSQHVTREMSTIVGWLPVRCGSLSLLRSVLPASSRDVRWRGLFDATDSARRLGGSETGDAADPTGIGRSACSRVNHPDTVLSCLFTDTEYDDPTIIISFLLSRSRRPRDPCVCVYRRDSLERIL